MVVSSVVAQMETGTAQVGDSCVYDNDCSMWKYGACCVKSEKICSADNGKTDANGN